MAGITKCFILPYDVSPIHRKGKALMERLTGKNLYEEDEDFPGDSEESSSVYVPKIISWGLLPDPIQYIIPTPD